MITITVDDDHKDDYSMIIIGVHDNHIDDYDGPVLSLLKWD